MNESMRGLFFIIKGQYTRGVEPSFINEVTKGVNHIGGYDPESADTSEWYMLVDSQTFICLRSSSNLDKVLRGVYDYIKRYKGDLALYERTLKGYRIATPSVACLYEEIYKTYGDYYEYEIVEMEDLAYKELKENTPLLKSRKLVSKNKKSVGLVKPTPKKEMVITTNSLNRLAKPKVKIGVKKLGMTE